MKKYLRRIAAVGLGLGISLAGVIPAFAADLTWSVDQTIDLSSPDINLTIVSGSTAESLVVGTGSVSITVDADDNFTITSAERDLSISGATVSDVFHDCNNGVTSITITNGADGDGETIVLTPDDEACQGPGGSGGGGGSGDDDDDDDSTPPVTPPGTPPGTPPSIPVPPPIVGGHTAGSVVKTSDGTVWFITWDYQRRPFTSAGAFLSHGFLSWSQVVDANAADLALSQGPFVPPMDGTLMCSDRDDSYAKKGTCYLITGSNRAAFVSGTVFTGLGFKFSRTLSGDVSFLATDTNITSTTEAHRRGVLVNNNGTIQLIGAGSLIGIPSMAVLGSWGYELADVVPSNAADRAMAQSSVLAARIAGQLSP